MQPFSSKVQSERMHSSFLCSISHPARENPIGPTGSQVSMPEPISGGETWSRGSRAATSRLPAGSQRCPGSLQRPLSFASPVAPQPAPSPVWTIGKNHVKDLSPPPPLIDSLLMVRCISSGSFFFPRAELGTSDLIKIFPGSTVKEKGNINFNYVFYLPRISNMLPFLYIMQTLMEMFPFFSFSFCILSVCSTQSISPWD